MGGKAPMPSKTPAISERKVLFPPEDWGNQKETQIGESCGYHKFAQRGCLLGARQVFEVTKRC